MFNNDAAKELANAVKEQSDLSTDQKIALAAVFAHLDQNDAARESIALGARMAGVSESALKSMTEAMDQDMRGGF